ncbi:hypothetical protein SRHO_G00124970 [Serrasalmus rhombeus]
MVMAQIWILILCLYITGSAQTVDLSEASFVSAKPGEPATLHCKFVEKFPKDNWFWYKQRSGQEPQEVAVKLGSREPTPSSSDLKIRFKINQRFSLTIEQTTTDDEGMYFCGKEAEKTITFSHGTFLAVAAQPQLNVSVVQTPAWRSVSPGESVTQQCMVHSKTGAAELRDSNAEEFGFAPLNFSDKNRLLKENAFTRVRFFPVSDFRTIQKHNIAEKRRK